MTDCADEGEAQSFERTAGVVIHGPLEIQPRTAAFQNVPNGPELLHSSETALIFRQVEGKEAFSKYLHLIGLKPAVDTLGSDRECIPDEEPASAETLQQKANRISGRHAEFIECLPIEETID